MAGVYLRALELTDLETTHKWHNDPELYQTLTGTYHYVSRYTEEQWLKEMVKSKDDELNLAICIEGTDEHIGNVYARNINYQVGHAIIHLFIGDKSQRSLGYGFLALNILRDLMMSSTRLNKIYFHVLADNEHVINLSQKFGCVIEGTLRQHAFKDGEFKDVVILAFYRDSPPLPPIPSE
ncbi:GNAT family N-acetyltransferase [Chloroflexota bacterium]